MLQLLGGPFWQPDLVMPAVVFSLFDEGVKSGCLVGRALYHHQRTPPRLCLQKFICPLKLLGLYLLLGKCLSNAEMNFSAAFLPYLNHLSSSHSRS